METKLSAKRQEIRVELEAGGRTIAAGTGDEMDWIRGVARVAAEAAESVAGIHASAYALPSGAQATAQAVYDPKGIALTIGIPAGAAGQDGADAAAPRMLSFSLPASGWAGSGPYTCAISEASVTANTAVVECVLTTATRANQIADIDWTTSAGSIALSTASKPIGELAGYMILTEVQ